MRQYDRSIDMGPTWLYIDSGDSEGTTEGSRTSMKYYHGFLIWPLDDGLR